MNEETARAGIRVREAEKAHNIRTFSQGGAQKRRTLIVSKLGSKYDPISQNTNNDTNHCILLIFKLNSFLIQCDEIELNLHKILFSSRW